MRRSRRSQLPRALVALCASLALTLAACGGGWGDLGLERVPHPPTEAMEKNVREKTLALRADLDAKLDGRDGYALTGAFGALGLHYHAHELHEAATACYRNAARLEPESAAWQYRMGVVAQATGDLGLAEESFGEALRLDPADQLARVRLAEVRLGAGDPGGAETILQDVVESAPDLALAHFFLGQVETQLGRPSEAVAAFKRALEAQPGATAVYYELALASRAAGDEEAAAAAMARRGDVEVTIDDPLLSQLNELNVGAVAHLRRGARAQLAGKWQQAERHYRDAVEADPGNPEARQSLGGVLAQRGAVADAIVQYRAALPRDSGALPRTNLASLLLATGEAPEALELLDAALTQDPEAETALQLRAAALAAVGRFDESIAGYEALFSTAGDRTDLLLGAARAHAGKGEIDRALALLSRAVAGAPEDPEPSFVRANLLGRSGRYVEAAESYVRVLDLAPQHTPAWLGEITAWVLAGDLDRASARAEAGLRAVPGDPDLLRAREEILARLGAGS